MHQCLFHIFHELSLSVWDLDQRCLAFADQSASIIGQDYVVLDDRTGKSIRLKYGRFQRVDLILSQDALAA